MLGYSDSLKIFVDINIIASKLIHGVWSNSVTVLVAVLVVEEEEEEEGVVVVVVVVVYRPSSKRP